MNIEAGGHSNINLNFTFDEIESVGKGMIKLNNSNHRDAILLRNFIMIFLQNKLIFSRKN